MGEDLRPSPPRSVAAITLVPIAFVVVIALIEMGAIMILDDIFTRSRSSDADSAVYVEVGLARSLKG
ncbi:hypothetical protein ACHABQ_13310 [Nesterenkonia aurantiaca]|uniref:hypothetical protein n=1 Tax=Nesterenkonia aurantiaca TaxID=1436010 RepID=UPI003EE4AAFD